jgi:hypothetical protein
MPLKGRRVRENAFEDSEKLAMGHTLFVGEFGQSVARESEGFRPQKNFPQKNKDDSSRRNVVKPCMSSRDPSALRRE